MQNDVKNYEVVVIGGGLAGVCAAIAAARNGADTLLVHDRSVLGGNSSSEIGVPVHGASEQGHYRNSRETGIIEELFAENARFPNPLNSPSVWSIVLWNACYKEPNLSLLLNSVARDPIVEKGKIVSIRVEQISTENDYKISGDIFIDCSGDGRVAFESGAEYTSGRESEKQYKESLAPKEADKFTMGNTIYLKAKDLGKKSNFCPPEWIHEFKSDNDFPGALADCPHNLENLTSGSGGYWWIEFGGEKDTIKDAEEIKNELLKYALGVWDHIKNKEDHGAENYVLESISVIPGRRESRRFKGEYTLTQVDIENLTIFYDTVAYGGWHIDIHHPKGVTNKGGRYWKGKFLKGRYGIPFRCLYSKNIANLLFAGRNISSSHVAMGSARVMATCAIIGEAAGTAAALCIEKHTLPKIISQNHIDTLQQRLLKQGCYIPGKKNCDNNDLALKAKVETSSEIAMILPEPSKYLPIKRGLAQSFVTDNSNVEKIKIKINNNSKEKELLALSIRKGEFIDDFRNKTDLFRKEFSIEPGESELVIDVAKTNIAPQGIYWLFLEENKHIAWGWNKQEIPGCQAGEVINQLFTEDNPERFVHRKRGSFSMTFHPEIYPYGGKNVISGITRPEAVSNLWVSHSTPEQWIKLSWEQEICFNNIILTFDSALDRTWTEWVSSGECTDIIKEYDIYIKSKSNVWEKLISVSNNYQRRNILSFPTVKTSSIMIKSSNSQNMAMKIFEIRIYKQ